jgi:hypothetical protein
MENTWLASSIGVAKWIESVLKLDPGIPGI